MPAYDLNMKWAARRNKRDDSLTFTLANRPLEEGDVSLWEIEAATWEEACAVYHIRMGWKPYQPGEPGVCPIHGADFVIYPERTGDCWKCLAEDEEASRKWAESLAKDFVAAGESEYGGKIIHNPPKE